MTDLVIDNSAAVQLARVRIAPDYAEGRHYAPELIDLEFTSALRKLVLRGELDEDVASNYIIEWAANDLVRCAHAMLLPRIWEYRNTITPYDASYVALAEYLDLPLLTADRRLAKAATEYCEVVVVDD